MQVDGTFQVTPSVDSFFLLYFVNQGEQRSLILPTVKHITPCESLLWGESTNSPFVHEFLECSR